MASTVGQARRPSRQPAGEEGATAAKKKQQTTLVWVPDDKVGWVLGKLLAQEGSKSEVSVGGVTKTFKRAEQVVPCLHSVLEKDYENLAEMEDFSEGAILYHVRKRFFKKNIYTYVGNIVVAINPYCKLDIYGPEQTDHFIDYVMNNPSWELEPHVYGVAAKAFLSLCSSGKNQSILISGESGAGKTETTKKALAFIADLVPTKIDGSTSPGSQASIEEKIMNSNPVLESFGNAKTVMNNNSSRFGKLMEVGLDGPSRRSLPRLDEWHIRGARIYNYILEKSRVTAQMNGERNFHVFYMLLEGASITELTQLGLGPGGLESMRSFQYLQQAHDEDYLIAERDEKREYQDMMQAFDILGVQMQVVDKLKRLLAAILHLGNVVFELDTQADKTVEGSRVSSSSQHHLDKAAELLGTQVDTLLMALIKLRTKLFERPSTPIQAAAARDALAKDLYRRMFDFIVDQCNVKIYNGVPRANIAILDIFGFEIFEQNSFEQLCINFANETLQGHFNKVVMAGEKALYEDERVEIDELSYEKNLSTVEKCLTLIGAKRMGMMSLLDDQVKQGERASDESWLRQMNFAFVKTGSRHYNDRYVPDRFSDTRFGVRHFAGTVTYEISGFVEKNKDRLPEQVVLLMRSSTEPLYTSWFEHDELEDSSSAPDTARARGTSRAARTLSRQRSNSSHQTNDAYRKRGNNRTEPGSAAANRGTFRGNQGTLGFKFKDQLRDLHQTLLATTPHFIRCIKPNQNKLGIINDEQAVEDHVFEGRQVLRQMTYSGLFEVIKIRKAGYMFRFDHADFCARYRTLSPSKVPRLNVRGVDWGEKAEIILGVVSRKFSPDPNERILPWVVGRTKVFVRTPKDQAQLEDILKNSMEDAVMCIQNWVREVQKRGLFQKIMSLIGRLNMAVQRMDENAYARCVKTCEKYEFLTPVLEKAAGIMNRNRRFMAEMRGIEARVDDAISARDSDGLADVLLVVQNFKAEHNEVRFRREEDARELLDILAKEKLTLSKIRAACVEQSHDSLDRAMLEADHLKLHERTWYRIGSVMVEILHALSMALPEIYVLTKLSRLQSLQQNVRIFFAKIDQKDVMDIVSGPDQLVQIMKDGKALSEVAGTVTTMLKSAIEERQYDTIMKALVFMDEYLPRIHMDRDGTFVEDNAQPEEFDAFITPVGSEPQRLSQDTKAYLTELTKEMFASRTAAVDLLEILENEAEAFRFVIDAIKSRDRGMLTEALVRAEANGLATDAQGGVVGTATRLLHRIVEEEQLEEDMEQVLTEHVGLAYENYDAMIQKAFDMGFEPRSFDAVRVTRSVLRLQNWFRSRKALKQTRTFRRAERQIRSAMESQDVEMLKKTIVNGHKTYGGETKLLKHARYVYEYVSRREKVVRDVVRGHAVVKNTHAIGYGMDLLGEAVETAEKHGITDIPKIQEAAQVYKNLARGRKARDLLRKIQKGCIVSNIVEEDLAQMQDIIRAAIQDCHSSPFPIDQPLMEYMETCLEIIQDKVNLMELVKRALDMKTLPMLVHAEEKCSLFREKHGLSHTKSMERKAEEVSMLLKLRMIEGDLKVASPPAKTTNQGGQRTKASFEADDGEEDAPIKSMREMVEELKPESGATTAEKKRTLRRLESLVGGRERLKQTAREHTYRHGLNSYRLGIRKDKHEERQRASKNKAANYSSFRNFVSPIKQQQKRIAMKTVGTQGQRPEWGVGQTKWFADPPVAPAAKKTSPRPGQRVRSSSERSSPPRHHKNRGPPETVRDKANMLGSTNDRRVDLKLRYEISQHLLSASLERQHEILTSLASDPDFMELYRRRGWG